MEEMITREAVKASSPSVLSSSLSLASNSSNNNSKGRVSADTKAKTSSIDTMQENQENQGPGNKGTKSKASLVTNREEVRAVDMKTLQNAEPSPITNANVAMPSPMPSPTKAYLPLPHEQEIETGGKRFKADATMDTLSSVLRQRIAVSQPKIPSKRYLLRACLVISVVLLFGLVVFIRTRRKAPKAMPDPVLMPKNEVLIKEMSTSAPKHQEKPALSSTPLTSPCLVSSGGGGDHYRVIKLKQGQTIPAGSRVRMNLTTGEQELLLPQRAPHRRWIFSTNVNQDKADSLLAQMMKSMKRQQTDDDKKEPKETNEPSLAMDTRQVDSEQAVPYFDDASYEKLLDEAYGRDTGLAILLSDYLSSMLGGKFQAEHARILTLLKAAMHNNEPALMRAEELNLIKYVIDVLRYEQQLKPLATNDTSNDLKGVVSDNHTSAQYIRRREVTRRAISCLHTLLCHDFRGISREDFEPSDEKKDVQDAVLGLNESLAKQFVQAGGALVINSIEDKLIDDELEWRVIGILVKSGEKGIARTKLANVRSPSNRARICHHHPELCMTISKKDEPVSIDEVKERKKTISTAGKGKRKKTTKKITTGTKKDALNQKEE